MNNSIQTRARGFSLVEMMVVLLILAVVLGIIIPALGYARNTARKTATSALMTQLATSCASFQLSERRLPGYFSVQDLGNAANSTSEGFTTMNNVMLDLAGGIVATAGATPTTVQVGPHAGARAYVDPLLIGGTSQASGAVNKAYFRPDPKNFVIVAGKDASTDNLALPDLIDLFGAPIMAWAQDDVPNTTGEFSSADVTTRSKFYWAQNAGFLKSTALGKLAINQRAESLLSAAAPPSGNNIQSMRALLGAPNFPDPTDATKPAVARAPIVFHSAGYNATYMGRNERGGKLATGGVVSYLSTKDKMEDFDDLLVKVSN